MTIIGAGGTAPNQSLGAEHSQPFHAYIMGIPGLKICTASKPQEAYGLAKSMIRDNSPGVLLLPVKLMKTRGPCQVDNFLPLHKATVHRHASQAAIDAGKAVTVLTYLHGTKEAEDAIDQLNAEGYDVDLVELRLQTHATLWHDATDAHLAYARHLALHPRWGRPFDARTRRDFYWALFDESETVLDPHGGPPLLVLRHHAVGDRGGCWWRCSLCFYDALERQ